MKNSPKNPKRIHAKQQEKQLKSQNTELRTRLERIEDLLNKE